MKTYKTIQIQLPSEKAGKLFLEIEQDGTDLNTIFGNFLDLYLQEPLSESKQRRYMTASAMAESLRGSAELFHKCFMCNFEVQLPKRLASYRCPKCNSFMNQVERLSDIQQLFRH